MRLDQLLLLCSTLCAQCSAYSGLADQQQPHVQEGEERRDHVPAYRHRLLSLHRDLVQVPSISGSEADAAFLLKDALTGLNYTVELQRVPSSSSHDDDASPERYNVLAWPGSNAERTLDGRVLVTSHIDVVPPYIPYRINGTAVPAHAPYDFAGPDITPDTLITGRGSVDAKASVAAQITAATDLVSAGAVPASSLVLLFVVGEEASGDGMKHFSASLDNNNNNHPRRPQFRAALFGEPTDNKLACGHKGIAGGVVRARGRAGHSGYPWLGKSATAVLVRALGRLLDADLGRSDRFGDTTVNVGVLRGGVAANVIASEASAHVAIRVAVGDQATGGAIVRERSERLLEETDAEALSVEFVTGYGPVECNCDVEGFETMIANYGTDVPNLQGDHVRYLYGPGSILVAHSDDEGLRVRDLEDAVEGYKKLILHAVNGGATVQ